MELLVSNSYEALNPVSIKTDIYPGESTKIKDLGVYQYTIGSQKKLLEDVPLSFEFDPEIFKITQNGVEISSDEYNERSYDYIGKSFTVERLRPEGSGIWIRAWAQDEDDSWWCAYERYWQFESCSFDNLFFKNDIPEYMYASDVPAENDTVVFELDTESIQKTHTVEWNVGIIEDGGNEFETKLDNRSYSVQDNKLTLSANKIKKAFEDLKIDDNYIYVYIRANVMINGSVAASADTGIELRTPRCELEEARDGTRLLGTESVFSKRPDCYIENKKYPDGEYIPVTLSDITIEQPEDVHVFNKTTNEDSFILEAVGCGSAVLTFKTTSDELGEREFTANMKVEEDMYEIYINEEFRNIRLLPGQSKKLNITAEHGYYDKEVDDIIWENVENPYPYITYLDYDTDVISVTKDGTITAQNIENGYSDLQIHFSIPRDGQDDYECDDWIYFNVANQYYEASAKKIYVEPGETVSSVPVTVKRFDTKNEKGVEVKNFTYQLETYEDDIKLINNNRGFTVNSNVNDGDWFDVEIAVSIPGEDEVTEYAWLEVEVCKHNFAVKSETKGTCTIDGSRTSECTKCHKSKKETIPKTNHSFSAWTDSSQATVFAPAQQTRRCTLCGKTESRTVGSKVSAIIKPNASSVLLKVKQSTKNFKVTLAAGDSVKSWTSSNKKVAAVSGKANGTCTIKAGKKAGNAVITIKTAAGAVKKIKVKVQKGAVKTTAIKNVPKKITLKKGQTYKLAPSIQPITSPDKVKYAVKDKKIITVNGKGMIKAKKAGKTKITVKAGKKTVTCTVVVTK